MTEPLSPAECAEINRVAALFDVPAIDLVEDYQRWSANDSGTALSFAEYAAQHLKNRIHSERIENVQRQPRESIQLAENPNGSLRVKNDTPQGRSIQKALDLLCAQSVGTASNLMCEAALAIAMVERENALLKIEVEDLKLRLRAAGVTIP